MLLALGGERCAARALRDAHALALAVGAELHIVRVVPNIRSASTEEPVSVARAIREAQRAVMAGRHTRGLCDRLLLEPLPSRSICVRLGAFVNQVAMRASELDADIIAIVPHRRQVGAVATRLALQTGCGVLVASGRGSFATLLAVGSSILRKHLSRPDHHAEARPTATLHDLSFTASAVVVLSGSSLRQLGSH